MSVFVQQCGLVLNHKGVSDILIYIKVKPPGEQCSPGGRSVYRYITISIYSGITISLYDYVTMPLYRYTTI